MKKFITVSTLVLMSVLLVSGVAQAYDAGTSTYANQIQLGNENPETMIINIINWGLGFLALLAVCIVIVGGFQWMTAGGNEEKTEGARKLLIAALIGLIIILAAWGISLYVINNLLTFTNAA